MNVSAQQTYVAQLLGDTSNLKWSNANHILPALNTAQFDLVHKLLAYNGENENVFDVLTEIQTSTTQSIDTTGYDLDGLADDPGPFIPGGYVASKCTIDEVTRWVSRIPMKNLTQQNNRYLKGNDERPMCYIYNNVYNLIITTGSYPISTTIYYIREPKALVASGASGYQAETCELNTIFHRLMCEMAAAECRRHVGDEIGLSNYQIIMEKVERQVQLIALGNAFEPKAEEIESWRKNGSQRG